MVFSDRYIVKINGVHLKCLWYVVVKMASKNTSLEARHQFGIITQSFPQQTHSVLSVWEGDWVVAE